MSAALLERTDEGIRGSGERLGDIARVEEAGRASDPLGDLLRTISEVLDIRDVFPRISRIANHLLAHDYLDLTVHDEAGGRTLRARSSQEFSTDHTVTDGEHDGFCLIGDLRDSHVRNAGHKPRESVDQLVAAGYRSLLSVGSPACRRAIRLGFFSKRPQAYTLEDVPAARRIADYLAVVVSHEQLASAERERLETQARAGNATRRTWPVVDAPERTVADGQPVGESAVWRASLMKATQVASRDTTVFLTGESGTGKEVLARFIHRASPRRNGPFVAINCAALPEQLLESELFGYERGAFTGAQQAKPGQIEMASTGVLFLDEVSEMSLAAQAKVLRFLQEREFQRLGGTRLLRANVRVIAASNRDLWEAVAQGTFREDLYYRLHVFDIPIPPLRERTSDIPLLADAFLSRLSRSMGRARMRIAPQATDRLLAHDWPGNVRELQNALERAAVLCEGDVIGPEHLSLQPAAVTRADPGTDLGAAERQTIERVLQETDGNKAKAARRLGITRTQLYVRLRRHGLEELHCSSRM